MEPSRTFLEEREQKARERMARVAASLGEEEGADPSGNPAVETVSRRNRTRRRRLTLPKLKIDDISREIETIPTERAASGGVPVLRHDLFTNGIAYLDLAFDVSDIPEELQPYLPLLGKLTTQMGAAGALLRGDGKADFPADRRPRRQSRRRRNRRRQRKLAEDGFSVKALHRNTDEAVGIIRDILTEGDLNDDARMRELILEKKNGLHASVIPSGHIFAQMAAAATLSLPAWRTEQWHGRTQLRLIAGTADHLKDLREEIREKLARLRKIVFVRNRLLMNMTADSVGLQSLTAAADGLVAALPAGNPPTNTEMRNRRPVHIGIAIPAQVCYVAKVLAAPPLCRSAFGASLHSGETTLQRLSLPPYPGSRGGLWGFLPLRTGQRSLCLPLLSGSASD